MKLGLQGENRANAEMASNEKCQLYSLGDFRVLIIFIII